MSTWSSRRRAIVFRVATPVPIRLWMGGFGDLRLPTSAIEPDPANRYRGCGELVGMPAVNQLVNGLAERVDFTLAGEAVTAEAYAMAASEAAEVRGAAVRVGLQRFDTSDQPIGPTVWRWTGWADVVHLNCQPGSDAVEDGPSTVRSVGLSVGSLFTNRQRPKLAYYTKQHQRLRSPDDAFCDRVAIYSPETGKLWKTS